ncbi:hypothetical protein WJX73_009840 [Symbiochloris irregularis]|uniref:C2 domain-containing protein n=1 Tax=Symbiochloris irregularis TaxID=706552 RepID=A0AAW1Q278_9CHLO
MDTLQSPFAGQTSGSKHKDVKDTLRDLSSHDSDVFAMGNVAPDQDEMSSDLPSHKHKGIRTRLRILKQNIFHPNKALRPEAPSRSRTTSDNDAQGLAQSESFSPSTQTDSAANLLLEAGRDLFVQVRCARDLTAADMNGLSDPYCVVRVGKQQQKTATVPECLSPVWNETFVFSAAEVRELPAGLPMIEFEVWDSDTLNDDFLGQANLEAGDVPVHTIEVEPHYLQLYALKGSKRVEGTLGSIEVAAWLAPTGALGRLGQSELQGLSESLSRADHRTTLSTMCSPEGVPKKIPAIVSSEGNTLFEEPCICYLPLMLSQVQCSGESAAMMAEQSSGSWTNFLAKASKSVTMGSQPTGSGNLTQRSSGESSAKRGRLMFPLPTLGRLNKPERSDSPERLEQDDDDEDDSKGHSEFKDDKSEANHSGDEWDELCFPEDDPDEADGTELTKEVNQSGDPPIAAQKMKSKALLYIELRMLATDSNKRKGDVVAHAFIPLADLLPQTREDVDSSHREIQSFRLHAESGNASIPFKDAVLELGMTTVDKDTRRAMYNQPLFETVASGQRKLLHELSHGDVSSDSPKWRSPPGDLKNDFDKFSAALHVNPSTGVSSAAMDRAQSSVSLDVSSSGQLEDASPKFAHSRHHQMLGHRKDSSFAMYSGAGVRRRKQKASALLTSVGEHWTTACEAIHEHGPRPPNFVIVFWSWLISLILQPCKGLWARIEARLPQRTPSVPRPTGVVKLLLQSVELLNGPEAVFCVLKCGPHWGKTVVVNQGDRPRWEWEVHLPMYDPDTLLLLTVFRDPSKKGLFSHGPPELLGKLRVVHFKPLAYNLQYLKPVMPDTVYDYGLHEGDAAQALAVECKGIVMRWLEKQAMPHTLPKAVAKAVLDRERSVFEMSRARANWRRVARMRNKMRRAKVVLEYVQSWKQPLVSLGSMLALIVLSFHPHIIISLVLLLLACYGWLQQPDRPGQPMHMESDPEEEQDDQDNVDSSKVNPYTALKRKYDRLLRAALAVQSAIDDVAQLLERMRATVSWDDPHQTVMFIIVCFIGAVVVAMVPWALIQSVVLCYLIRPPFLRTPTPPPPASFFMRLPTKADQII